MRINSESSNASDLFDDSAAGQLYRLEPTVALNNVTKRDLSHSMLAYTQKMQALSNLRKESVTAIQEHEHSRQERTAQWAFRHAPALKSPPLGTSALSHNSTSVGRKWATLAKLRKPPIASVTSVSDPHCNNKDGGIITTQPLSNVPPPKLAPIGGFQRTGRSRSVLDLIVNKHTNSYRIDSPHMRPSSEHDVDDTTVDARYAFTHTVPVIRRNVFSPTDLRTLENYHSCLKSETNILTLPDVKPSTADMASSVQIVPFPAITELQAVPAKLHTSTGTTLTHTKKTPPDSKIRPIAQKSISLKDNHKDISNGGNKDLARSRGTVNDARNGGPGSVKILIPNKLDKSKSKPMNSVPKSTNNNEKDTNRKDTTKDKVTTSKVRKKTTDIIAKPTEKALKTNDTSAIKSSTLTTDNELGDSKKPAPGKTANATKTSSPTKIAQPISATKKQAFVKHSPPATVVQIKSVLKKRRPPDSDDGEPVQPSIAKTVQFGPRYIREVTKIVYPWNVDHSSSEDDEETAIDDDDTTLDDDDTTVDDDDEDSESDSDG